MADQNFKAENLSEFLRKILIPTDEISGRRGELTPTPSELKAILKSKQKKQLIEKSFL